MRTTLETNALKYAGKAQRFTLQSLKKELDFDTEEEEKALLQKLFQEKQLKYEPMYAYRYIKVVEEFPELEDATCVASILRYARMVELFTFSSLQVEIAQTVEILERSVQELVALGCLERMAILGYHFIGKVEEVEELSERQAYLEKRRQEILARMQAASQDEDDDDDEDDLSSLFEFDEDDLDKDDSENEDNEWKELCLLGLKKSIEEQRVSCSFLQRKLCVGYNKAQKILEWMLRENYITRKGKYVYHLEIQKKDFDVLCYKMRFPNLAFEELTEEEQASYALSDLHSATQRKIEVCKALQAGYSISTGHMHKIIVGLDMCYPNDTPYRIELKENENICFFSDNGLTMGYLKENVDIQEPLIAKKIENIINQFNIKVVEEELHFKISSQAALSVLMFFIIAIDKLVDLATQDCIHQACEQIDEKCYSVIMEYFCSNDDLSRGEIISKVKEDLSNVAEHESEKIVVLEHIIRGFACISDEYYATIKKEFMRHKSDE